MPMAFIAAQHHTSTINILPTANSYLTIYILTFYICTNPKFVAKFSTLLLPIHKYSLTLQTDFKQT